MATKRLAVVSAVMSWSEEYDANGKGIDAWRTVPQQHIVRRITDIESHSPPCDAPEIIQGHTAVVDGVGRYAHGVPFSRCVFCKKRGICVEVDNGASLKICAMRYPL